MPTSILLFLFFNKEQRLHRVILLTFVSSIFLIKEVLKGFHYNLYYSSVIDSKKRLFVYFPIYKISFMFNLNYI